MSPAAPKSLLKNPSTNDALVEPGRPIAFTNGVTHAMMSWKRPTRSNAQMITLIRIKIGINSLIYITRRVQVFLAMCESFGHLSGGSSMKKLGCAPGTYFLAINPIAMKFATITANQIHNDVGWVVSNAMITPSWAEHGIVRAMSTVAMLRSLSVSSVLVTIVAILPQPTAKTNGILFF